MASFTLTRPDVFASGTVNVYRRSDWAPGRDLSGAPPGSSVTSAAVSGGSVTFSGLATDTAYVAGQNTAGGWRYVGFRVPSDSAEHNVELGYAEITSNNVSGNGTNGASGAVVDIAGLAIVVVESDRPYIVEFDVAAINSVASQNLTVTLQRDGVNARQRNIFVTAVNGGGVFQHTYREQNPVPGTSRAYKLNVWSGSGTRTVAASALAPAFLHAVEV